ncbi:uncharacterized protein ColSpa_01194 [Colletotrichum spaethianum]|uniref:Chitinase n=1 Tax=Colletotrichum spaethianum TaxID=700344 RepID=A0AA37L7D3_9PEZI|nr:uncharacterized protein ColSpa_01194 [Colletotrichum spaethianum]GKT41013.1 hypothetical protein ColSpa_01194 [Colletotrichum spaethianum]
MAPGKDGCISNCGRDIVKGPAPAKKVKLGYFEGWNFNRQCLTLDEGQINTDAYTHLHFAFPNVTRGDFRSNVSIPSHCLEKYIVDVQIAVSDGALKKYKKLIDNGYDKNPSIWEGYIKEQIPGQIKNFMATDKGGKCFGGGHPNTTFTLDDRNGFFKDILETWGIEEEWIRFEKRQMSLANSCQYADKDVNDCIAWNSIFFHDFPTMDRDKTKMHNPKDVIVKALPGTKGLLDRYRDMKTFAEFEDDFEMSNVTDAGSLPAFTIEEAVAQMDNIVEEAKEIEKKRREEFILNMIMGFLFFIPFNGPTGGGVIATGVRTLLQLVEVGAEVDLAVYSIFHDRDKAFMTVFSILLGTGFSRGKFRDAANSRRGMSSGEYNTLGNVKPKLDSNNNFWGGFCSVAIRS